MIIALVLATISTSIIVFLAGYRLAIHHYKNDFGRTLELMQGESLEPIFDALNREWAYTDDLNRPFNNDK